MEQKMVFTGDIMSKPRMTRKDKWEKRPCVMRYRQFCDDIRTAAEKYEYYMGSCVEIIFFLPMPASWSLKKKKAMCNQPHQQKPDIDNLEKAILDALNLSDAHIYHVTATKYWTANKSGCVLIRNISIPINQFIFKEAA